MTCIIDKIKDIGSFHILCAALDTAGLIRILKGPGPFTLFAPNDVAFSKLPTGTVEDLIREKRNLKNILLYHIMLGSITSEALMEKETVNTLQGQHIYVDMTTSFLVNNANVIMSDIEADNGIIHILDTVIAPWELMKVLNR